MDVPVLHRLQHAAALLPGVAASHKAALVCVGRELGERLRQMLLQFQIHLLGVKGGKARRVDDFRAAGQLIELNMARCMPSASERLTDLSCFERHGGIKCIENARLADAGVACYGGEPSDKLGAELFDALARFRADTDGAKACVFIVFAQRIRGV